MQDDITDGVQWLMQQGVADSRRVGIYGASHGGYATLAGVTFTPDLYAAAVNYVGVSNLFTFMNTIPPHWRTELVKLQEMVGHPERDKERLTRTSPALNAERIKTPLMVVQGARDPRVNKAESDQMVEALKVRGVDVPYLVKDNEGHAFRNEENQYGFYGAMESFFGQTPQARCAARLIATQRVHADEPGGVARHPRGLMAASAKVSLLAGRRTHTGGQQESVGAGSSQAT